MAAFHYNALDAEGKPSNGMIEADSARLARTQLRETGLFVVELNSLSDIPAQGSARSFNLPFRKRIPLSEVSLMLRQLATLLEAGLPLEQALAVLIEQGDNPAMRQVIAAMRSEVLAGNTLARAMEKHRDTFPEIHRALINAGEASGELATVMDKLASYSEAQQALQQKIGLAMVYPAIVILVATLVVGGLLLFVVPPVVEVFQQTHQNLPFLTRALIALSDFLFRHLVVPDRDAGDRRLPRASRLATRGAALSIASETVAPAHRRQTDTRQQHCTHGQYPGYFVG